VDGARVSWRLQFALLALVWGPSFLFIKVAVEDVAPVDVAFVRVALGAAVLLVLAYLLNYAVIRKAGATTAVTVTYVVPVVSTLLGVIVLAEGLDWNQPAGAAVVLVSVAASQGLLSSRRTRRRSRAT